MTNSWQDVTTAVILLLTLGYLIYRVVRTIRRKGFPACGCCTKCPAEPPEKRLVGLDDAKEKQRQ